MRSSVTYLVRRIDGRFGSSRAREISADHVQGFLDNPEAQGLAASSVNHHRTVLSSIFSFAIKRKKYGENPVTVVAQKREPGGRDRFLTPEEFGRLVAGCSDDQELAAAIIVLATTTLRKDELLSRKGSEVHVEGATPFIRVPRTKTGEPTTVLLARAAAAALRRLASFGTAEYVFPSRPTARVPAPKRPYRWNIGEKFHQRAERVGLVNVRLHDLRHLGASILTERGIPESIISRLTGHRSRKLERYQHLSAQLKAQTVDVIAEELFGAAGFPTGAPTAQGCEEQDEDAEREGCNFLQPNELVARPAGFEPATLGLEGPMSDRLYQDSYILAPVQGPGMPESRRKSGV